MKMESTKFWFQALHTNVRFLKTLPFEKKLILFFSIIFIGIIAVGVSTFRYHESMRDADSLVKHNREVLYESERVLSMAQDIVLGSRGYIITGDSSFLQPFIESKSIISEHVNKLINLTKGTPSQEQRTDSLEKLISKRIDLSIQSIQVRNQKGFAEAKELIASGEGKYFMDEIRNTVFSLQQEENDLLREQTEILDKSKAAFDRLFFALLGSIFILLIIVFFSVRRNLSFRKKYEEGLLIHKQELEQKIQVRTSELEEANMMLKRNEELLNDTGSLAKVGGWEIMMSDMTWSHFHGHTVKLEKYSSSNLSGQRYPSAECLLFEL